MIEIRHIQNLFNFDYNFYDEEHKQEFENKFIEYFYFDYIGFETIDRFRQRLRELLNRKYPYYKQLYETELRTKEIDFMLNKDLKETFLSEVNSEGNATSSDQTNTSGNSNSENSSLDYPHSKVSNIRDGYISSGNIDKSESNSIGSSSSEQSTSGKSITKNEVISQGNIGVTSSAELLQRWRDVLINIDEIILFDCNELMLGVMI